jgi:hypothetical protein
MTRHALMLLAVSTGPGAPGAARRTTPDEAVDRNIDAPLRQRGGIEGLLCAAA